jgi:predicted metal-binding membrane protein
MTMGGASWDLYRTLATFIMWVIMMGAMMLPSAAPIVLLHRRMALTNKVQGAAPPPTSLLISGYALVWIAFAGMATAAQWLLLHAMLLTDGDALADHRIAGGVLVAAGLYQWTPLKQTCLRLCRSPLAFLMRDYRSGKWGALHMGLKHGAYCLACCWAAMALLFVGGVMNLLWIAALAVFVLIEKAAPYGQITGRLLGVAAILFGIFQIVGLPGPHVA